MNNDDNGDALEVGSEIDPESLRTRPVQQRSTRRVTLLLDAAAALIDEKGIDGLTTTDVSSTSGSSVGVVYRYYPNIQSLLSALANRNIERFMARAAQSLKGKTDNWLDGLDPIIDVTVDMMRNEPGFRALRFGTIIDYRTIDGSTTSLSHLAERFTDSALQRYGVADTPELRFDIEVAVEVAEALIQRAFAHDKNGDARFLDKARDVMHFLLASHATS
ncbi:MAG: TetR family transcriptional regulator [Microbacteriaceae bacterium]